jgi:Protein of unknown function (DUF1579)
MKSKTSKPHPAIKKLGYFVGRWVVEGEIVPGPWGAGGKFSWTETTKWMRGKFFVVGHWDFKMPRELGGDGEEIFVMGYDAHEKQYTFNAFSSQGLRQVSSGTLRGKSWTWDSEGTQAGQRSQQRLTMRVLSRKRYALKFEVSNALGKWTTFMTGVAVKK